MRQFVGIILVKKDGSVLAQHRDDDPTILGSNTWAVVGGSKEERDGDLKKTAIREIQEETGYQISDDNLQFLTEDDYVTERGTPVHRTIFWAWYDEQQLIQCFEGQEMRFVSPDELQTISIYNRHKEFFEAASRKSINK